MDSATERDVADAPGEQMNLGAMLGITLAAVLGTTFSVWAWHFVAPGTGNAPKAAAAVPRVAVLPFRSLSGQAEDERIDAALTNDLIGELAKRSEVQLLPAAIDLEPTLVGRQLGAQFLILGLVERPKGSLKVTVQMVSTRDGKQFWKGEFAGDARQTAALSSLISQAVSSHLTALVD